MIIVFGASGFVGSRLFRHFREISPHVVGTFSEHPVNDAVRFDLTTSRLNDLKFDRGRVHHALIAAGNPSIDGVRNDPLKSHELNIASTIRLIDALSAMSIVPIFFSTDYVFDGRKGNYREEDERNPTTLYGKQKVMVEDHLIRNIPRYLLIRISKIFSLDRDEKNWPVSWMLRSLLGRKPISCAVDQRFCSTLASDVAAGIERLIRQDAVGLYHMAAPASYSRWEIALRLCEAVGADKSLVKPVKINGLNFMEERPIDLTLDSSKFASQTRFVFTDIMDCVGAIADAAVKGANS